MVKIKPGDVLAIKYQDFFYYVVIISKVVYFGGNLVFAYHLKTKNLLTLDELMKKDIVGFNAIVDFIFAKRENRIAKVGQTTDYLKFKKHKYFKSTFTIKGTAKSWKIIDENFKDIANKEKLDQEEKGFPLAIRIDDTIMIDKINNSWLPELDERI